MSYQNCSSAGKEAEGVSWLELFSHIKNYYQTNYKVGMHILEWCLVYCLPTNGSLQWVMEIFKNFLLNSLVFVILKLRWNGITCDHLMTWMRADSGKKEDDINALYGPIIQIIYKFLKFLCYKYFYNVIDMLLLKKEKVLLLLILNLG